MISVKNGGFGKADDGDLPLLLSGARRGRLALGGYVGTASRRNRGEVSVGCVRVVLELIVFVLHTQRFKGCAV